MNERHTAYAIRNALDESARRLTEDQERRLEQMRRRALSEMPTRRQAPGLARRPRRADDSPPWLARLVLAAAPLGLVAVGAFALVQWSAEQRIETLAELDKAVLLDDLPLSAYADAGFGVFLKHTRQ